MYSILSPIVLWARMERVIVSKQPGVSFRPRVWEGEWVEKRRIVSLPSLVVHPPEILLARPEIISTLRSCSVDTAGGRLCYNQYDRHTAPCHLLGSWEWRHLAATDMGRCVVPPRMPFLKWCPGCHVASWVPSAMALLVAVEEASWIGLAGAGFDITTLRSAIRYARTVPESVHWYDMTTPPSAHMVRYWQRPRVPSRVTLINSLKF